MAWLLHHDWTSGANEMKMDQRNSFAAARLVLLFFFQSLKKSHSSFIFSNSIPNSIISIRSYLYRSDPLQFPYFQSTHMFLEASFQLIKSSEQYKLCIVNSDKLFFYLRKCRLKFGFLHGRHFGRSPAFMCNQTTIFKTTTCEASKACLQLRFNSINF